jgi:serine/threonine protein kinase
MTILKPQEIVNQRYQLERQLGQNAGRETWLAKNLQKENELVVVKLLAFGGNVQWEDLKLFEREANVLKQLNHPRIPKYRDYFSIDDRSLWFGLVQEYIQGESLREYIAKGHKFTELQVKKIAIAILEILIYLHELSPQVLHRDIKPSNLILSGSKGKERNIYLVDFGAVQDKASAEGKSFTVVGTYGYAPMEQYGGRAVAASDLYALGATLIYLLTGISPAELPQDDDARILFSDRTSVKPHFLQWIQKLVEPTVKKRYPSARIALQALSEPPQISTVQPVISVPATPYKQSQSSSSTRRYYPPDNTNITVESSSTQLSITIPCRIWETIFVWVLIGIIISFIQPFFSGFFIAIEVIKNYFWIYVGIILLQILLLGLSLNTLTAVKLELGEKQSWLMRSLFGKTYWQTKFLTSELQSVEPKWTMIDKRNSGILDDLFWASRDHNEDNSTKSNVILVLQKTVHVLAAHDIRPTEVNWLISVIEEFLDQPRRK